MIDFHQAVAVAQENMSKLIEGARNVVLEGVLLSADESSYEVSFSYDLDKPDPLAALNLETAPPSNVATLAALLGSRKERKVFIVEGAAGKFRGFTTDKKY